MSDSRRRSYEARGDRAPRRSACARRAGRPDHFTTALERPLCAAAVSTTAAFGLLATPAGAAQGADRCPGALEVPAATGQSTSGERDRLPRQRGAREPRAAPAQARRRPRPGRSRPFERHGPPQLLRPQEPRRRERRRPRPRGRLRHARRRVARRREPRLGQGRKATPNGLVDAWLASPAQKRIMLEHSYRELGDGRGAGRAQATGGCRARRTR